MMDSMTDDELDGKVDLEKFPSRYHRSNHYQITYIQGGKSRAVAFCARRARRADVCVHVDDIVQDRACRKRLRVPPHGCECLHRLTELSILTVRLVSSARGRVCYVFHVLFMYLRLIRPMQVQMLLKCHKQFEGVIRKMGKTGLMKVSRPCLRNSSKAVHRLSRTKPFFPAEFAHGKALLKCIGGVVPLHRGMRTWPSR